MISTKKHITLILPSLSSGGMERVMTQLAYYFVGQPRVRITLLLMTKSEQFYTLPEKVEIIEPSFDHRDYHRIVFTFKILFFVRKQLKNLNPQAILSFGGKYNAFVMLASLGLKIKVFLSDRSRPTISYGKLQDFLNPIMYRYADGIIAQTKQAKNVLYKKTKHQNIQIIGNPIREIEKTHIERENIILNVGRFISSKKQEWLIDYFSSLNLTNWRLLFLGEGPEFEKIKKHAAQSGAFDRIEFKGNIKDIDFYYNKASIFAFTSISEGFPNALGEAMSAGMACISFDCEAGPSDLIDNEINGFLIPMKEHAEYKKKLNLLCTNKELRKQFGKAAMLKSNDFRQEVIGKKYYDFIFKSQ